MPFPTIEDALVKTQVFAFDGISFPIATFGTDFNHDIAQHKRPDRDGARLEHTGRNPITLQVHGLFYNGLIFDISANTSDLLYPTVYKAALLRCADGTTGNVVHPELGTLRMKCVSWKSVTTAERRDGCAVDMSFVEDNEDSDGDLGTASPLAFATFSATALDAQLNALSVKYQQLARDLANRKTGASFADTLRQVRGVSDQIGLIQKQGAAIIPGMQRDLQITGESLERLKDTSTNTAKQLVERLKAALYQIQATQLVTASVLRYVVPVDQTLASLSAALKTTQSDLLRLNPALANTFPPGVIRATTAVRYYVPGASKVST